MNYSEYRKARLEGEALTLPSGLEVRVKKVTLMDLALNGEIPQSLHALTDDHFTNGREVQITVEDMSKYGAMVALVIKACLVEPAVADVSDDEHIALKDMEGDDKLAIWQWANRGAARLRKFRKEQASDVGALQSNGHDPLAPVASLESDG